MSVATVKSSSSRLPPRRRTRNHGGQPPTFSLFSSLFFAACSSWSRRYLTDPAGQAIRPAASSWSSGLRTRRGGRHPRRSSRLPLGVCWVVRPSGRRTAADRRPTKWTTTETTESVEIENCPSRRSVWLGGHQRGMAPCRRRKQRQRKGAHAPAPSEAMIEFPYLPLSLTSSPLLASTS